MHGEMYLVGGAAMILEYEAARVTTDIDCVINEGADRIHEAAAEIAAERPGLAGDWLNETAAAAHHVPEDPDDKARPSYQGSHLTVTTASAERMLAMKLHARRGTDLKDIEQLLKFSKVGSGEEAKQLTEQHFPHSEVPADAVRKVDDAITKASMQGPPSGPSTKGAPTETARAVAARMADELQERRETQGSRGLPETSRRCGGRHQSAARSQRP